MPSPSNKPSTGNAIQNLRLSQAREQHYFVVVPEQPSGEILVLVHGISRNCRPLLDAFLAPATARGVTLIAPLFDEQRCRDYQRLGRNGRGPRADLILEAIVDEVAEKAGLCARRFSLFGHSAGAQFAHRYALAHALRVKHAAIAAPGWYTLPNTEKYPYGTAHPEVLPGVQFVPAHFLRVAMRVYVGERDCERHASLNGSKRLDRTQGLHRLDRAECWVKAMRTAATEHGLKPQTELHLLPNVGHDFQQASSNAQLPELVIDWMYPAAGR